MRAKIRTHQSVIMHSLICGLQPEPFSYSFFIDSPNNMEDLRECVVKYMII